MDELKKAGFWYSRSEPCLPRPIAGSLSDQERQDLVKKLMTVESQTPYVQAKGMSECRLCKELNGSIEYRSSKWAWPEGLLHYVDEHGVDPGPAFREYINNAYMSTPVIKRLVFVANNTDPASVDALMYSQSIGGGTSVIPVMSGVGTTDANKDWLLVVTLEGCSTPYSVVRTFKGFEELAIKHSNVPYGTVVSEKWVDSVWQHRVDCFARRWPEEPR